LNKKNGIVQEHYSVLPALSLSPSVSYKPWQMSGLRARAHTHTHTLQYRREQTMLVTHGTSMKHKNW